jgi:hypothetical protein
MHFSVHDYESAKDDYEKVLTFEPGNKAAKNRVLICYQKLKQFKEKEKHIYAGMFNKFADSIITIPKAKQKYVCFRLHGLDFKIRVGR